LVFTVLLEEGLLEKLEKKKSEKRPGNAEGGRPSRFLIRCRGGKNANQKAVILCTGEGEGFVVRGRGGCLDWEELERFSPMKKKELLDAK